MAKLSDAPFESALFVEQASDVAAPPAGHWRLEFKAGGLYAINDTGAVIGPFATSSGSALAVGAKARRTATQSIANNTPTMVDLTDADVFDPDDFHDPAVNPSRMTVPAGKDGKYVASGFFQMSSGSTGHRIMGMSVNGTPIDEQLKTPANASGSAFLSMTVALDLVAGDYVEMACTHTQGAALNITLATLSLLLVGL